MINLKEHIMPLISFVATLILTFISIYVVKLSDESTFLIFSTGSLISLSLALLEQELNSNLRKLNLNFKNEIVGKLELYRLVDRINDEELRKEVFSLAKSLSLGEIPPHIASVRSLDLYRNAKYSIYASNYNPTLERLYQWEESARLKSLLEINRGTAQGGVNFTRTFILHRNQIILSDNKWDQRSYQVLKNQADAGIKVRILWVEDLQKDNLPPQRKFLRNFAIFDREEVLTTSDVQVLYRSPSERLQEFLALQEEQIKYSQPLERL